MAGSRARGTTRSTDRGIGRSRPRGNRNDTSNTQTSQTPTFNMPQDDNTTDPTDTSQGISTSQGPRQGSAVIRVSDLPDYTQINSGTPELIPSRHDYVVPTVPSHTGLLPRLWVGDNAAQNEEDMDDWMREDLGDISPSSMEGLAGPFTPPQDPAEFFGDLFEQTARSIDDASRDLVEGAIAPPPTPAMVLAPPPAGFLAPRSRYPLQTTNTNVLTQLNSDSLNQVMSWATNIDTDNPGAEPLRPLCAYPDCPMADIYHREGVYVHDNSPATNYLETFGPSNPPPSVWQAIQNGCHWMGTQQDADLITRFIDYHAIGGNFFIAPHTNFLWGEEVNDPQAIPGAPSIRLPFPATPLRIDFDASLNLPSIPFTFADNAAHGPVFRRCTDTTCPILEEHGVGMYRQNGLPPRIRSAAFGHSNPPDYVWAAFDRATHAQAYDLQAANSDRWTIANYQRLHVTDRIRM